MSPFSEPATEQMSLPGQPDSASIQPSPSEKMFAPNFVVPVQSVQATDGQELRMPCKVTGKPMPQISWYHNGKNIDQDEEYVITYNPDTGDISLLIVEVFPEDDGEYVCVAHNPAGDAVTRANLVVAERMDTPVAQDVSVDETKVKKAPEVETVPETKEVTEEELKPALIERPKSVPIVETERPKSPTAEEFTPAVAQLPTKQEEVAPAVVEEDIKPLQKPKAQAPTEPKVITEDELTPEVIERPELKPMEEEKPKEPSPEYFTPAVTKPVEKKEEPQPEVTEEVVKPEQKPKAEAPTETIVVTEEELKPDVIERPKLVPMEETKPREPSPEEVVDGIKPTEQPTEEAPSVDEEILEQEVKPTKIDRPLPTPIVKETHRPESPVYEEIGEAPIYEEIPERPPKEVQEEVLESTVKQQKINRPMPKSIIEEKVPEEEPVEEVIQPVFDKPEEVGPVIEEENVVPEKITKKVDIPELKPGDESMDKKDSRDDEEAPRQKEEIHVEDIYATIDETAPVEEVSPEFVELLPPQAVRDGDKVVLKCKVVGNPVPTVSWFKDDEEIQPSADFQMLYEPATGVCSMEIPEVFPEDAGEYACRAVNAFGDSVTTANLLVEGNTFKYLLTLPLEIN